MKFYITSGSVRWVVGGCVSSRHAAEMFVDAFARSKILEMRDRVLVCERGFRTRRGHGVESFDVRELLVQLRQRREEGGDNGTIR